MNVMSDKPGVIRESAGQVELRSTDQREKSNNTGDRNSQQHRPPLGVKLTGYYLFVTIVILVFGIPNDVYAYKGQPLISTILDLVGGAPFALLLFWLGVIDAKRPELCPLFFQTDLASLIWRFLSRDGVIFWSMSFTFVLLNTKQLHIVLGARQGEEYIRGIMTNHPKDELILHISELIASISTFCVLCVRVAWPRGFKENRNILMKISLSMWWVHAVLYLVIPGVLMARRGPPFPLSIIPALERNYLPMVIGTSDTLFGQRDGEHGEERAYSPPEDLTMAALVVAFEVMRFIFHGFLDFPEGLCVTFFSCCLVVLYSHRLLATVLKSSISLISRVWKA